MKLAERDIRALRMLAIAAVLGIAYWLIAGRDDAPKVVGAVVPSGPAAVARLNQLRDVAATLAAKQEILKQVSAEVALREKGLIEGNTAAEAQAQLLQILKKIARKQTPPINVSGQEIGAVKPMTEDYGEVSVTLGLDCVPDQMVNFIADLSAQPEILATSNIRVSSQSQADKRIAVRVTVSGIVPRKLVPKEKSPNSF